jgi:prepilin-type processing-associated H-X9-DG protein
VCMTNIRTITTASMTYAADYDSKYPLGGSRPLRNWSSALYPDTPYWDARLMPYIDSGYNIDPALNRDDYPASPLNSVNPDIFNFLLCPAANSDPDQRQNINRIRDDVSSRNVNRFPRSYRMNSKLTGAASVSREYGRSEKYYYSDSLSVSQVNNSAKTILVAESFVTDASCFNSINGYAARSWGDVKPAHFIKKQGNAINNYIWEGSSDNYERSGQTNMGFADGHIDKLKRVYTNDYWQYGGEPETVGIKFMAVGPATVAEEGLR